MKRTIILHGKLALLAPGGRLELDVGSPAESIKALSTLFSSALRPDPVSGPMQLYIPGYDTQNAIFSPLEDDATELHIVPTFAGGKSGGAFIIVGTIIIAAAAFYAGSPMGVDMFGWSPSIDYTSILSNSFLAGGALILNGVLQLLSPAPQMDRYDAGSAGGNPEGSLYLGAPKNTARIGTRIPILYGKFRAYGQLLSVDIRAVDVAG